MLLFLMSCCLFHISLYFSCVLLYRLENSDHFVEATENQYSLELNQYLSDQRQNAMWTMPSLGCIMDDLSPQKIKLGAAGRTARGLVATEELAPNQPIVEYRGMLMLRDQFVPANGWTKKWVLMNYFFMKYLRSLECDCQAECIFLQIYSIPWSSNVRQILKFDKVRLDCL